MSLRGCSLLYGLRVNEWTTDADFASLNFPVEIMLIVGEGERVFQTPREIWVGWLL